MNKSPIPTSLVIVILLAIACFAVIKIKGDRSPLARSGDPEEIPIYKTNRSP